jgi:hypothetical protein
MTGSTYLKRWPSYTRNSQGRAKTDERYKNMKIAMCTPMFLPVLGGAEKYVYDLSEFLIDRKPTVGVFTLNLFYWKRARASAN